MLADAGYRYGVGEDGADGEERHGRGGERQEHGSETFHVERIGIVVVDGNGLVILDNLSRLRPGTPAPELSGQRVGVTDGASGEPVGAVYMDVDRAFLATESHGCCAAC